MIQFVVLLSNSEVQASVVFSISTRELWVLCMLYDASELTKRASSFIAKSSSIPSFFKVSSSKGDSNTCYYLAHIINKNECILAIENL